MRLIQPLFYLLYVAATVAWLLCLSAYYIEPSAWRLPVVFSFGFLALLLPQLVLAAYWLFKRSKWAILPLLLLLIGWPQLNASFQLGLFNKNDEASDNELTVTSFNLQRFHNQPIRNEAEINRLVKAIHFHKKLTADIVCFQESFGYMKPILDYVLKRVDYPYHYSNFYGNAVFSKFPIINEHYDPLTNKHNGLIYVDIVKGRDTIRVIDIHLQSLSFGDTQFETINNPLANDHGAVRQLFGKVARGSVEREKQIKMVLKYLEDSPYPVILCSDLNATPTSYAYRQLSTSLDDSFVVAGSGLSPTYAGPIPGLRIDYVFYDSKMFKATHYAVDYTEKYSDHFPVKTRLRIK